MLIRDLLDSYDDVQENFQDVLQRLTRGQSLAAANLQKKATLRVSKRIVKPRGEALAAKRKGHQHRHQHGHAHKRHAGPKKRRTCAPGEATTSL